MGLSDALNNLVNKISGGGSGAGTPAKTNAAGSASSTSGAGTGGGPSNVGYNQAETAIGNELAGIDKEPLSAKSAEEKASSAIEDLMSKLGLTSGAEDELAAVKTEIENEIKTKKDEQAAKELEDAEKAEEAEKAKEAEEAGEVDTTGIDKEFDEMTQEELEALKEELDDYLEFSPEEADAYVKGEAELQSRIDEAVEKNPDMDPAAIEKEIREAYELENPEWAEAAKEAERVEAKHSEAMETEYNAFCEENPQPVKEDFDSPQEYAAAMNEWSAEAEKYMADAEEKYRAENENYDNLKTAEENNNILDNIIKKWQTPKIEIDPSDLKPFNPDSGIELPTYEPDPILRDPGFEIPTITIDPTWSDPGFSKVIIDPDDMDPGFSININE